MTELFDRGDCVWFESVRGVRFVVIEDMDQQVRFSTSDGSIYMAEVGTDSIAIYNDGSLTPTVVERDEIHFE